MSRGAAPRRNGCVARTPATKVPPDEFTWAGTRHIPEEVGSSLQELGTKVELATMEPRTNAAQGNRVIVEGGNRGTVRATGLNYEHEWVRN